MFVKYLQAIDIIALLLGKFGSLKKSRKGVTLKNLFLQVLCFFFDGTSRHMNYFDQLQEDAGYAAVLEVPEAQMASSHAAVFRYVWSIRGGGISLGAQAVVCLAVEIKWAESG